MQQSAMRITWALLACSSFPLGVAAQDAGRRTEAKKAAVAKTPADDARLPRTDGARPFALANPGFEEGEAAVSAWMRGAALDGVEYKWDKAAGHKSKASVCIRKTAQKFFPVAQWHQSVAHDGKSRRLRVSAMVKADKVRKAIIDVQYTDASGETTGHQWAAYIGAKEAADPPVSHAWKEYSGVVAVPEGARSVVIALQAYGPGNVWFDDVTAEYVADETPPTLYDEAGNPKSR